MSTTHETETEATGRHALFDGEAEADEKRLSLEGPEGPAARIRTVHFREKLRGYHPEDVDTFLEKLALVVEDLEARLADAGARLAEADRRSTVATAGEQTVRRTLVLAQRTAELAVAEAKNRAEAIVAEAEERAQARVAAVEDECVAVREREERALREELGRLEDAQVEARRRLEALEARRAEEHGRLTEALADLAAVVDARLAPPQ